MPEGNIVRLTPYKVRVYDMELNRVEPDMMEVNWNVDAAMKNGFPHFMLKEIHEQPDALKNTILPRLSKGLPDLTDDGIPDFILKDCSRNPCDRLRNRHARRNGGKSSDRTWYPYSGHSVYCIRIPL